MAANPVDIQNEGIPMLRTNRISATAFAIFLAAGAFAPSVANAWPLGHSLHLHPQTAKTTDTRVSLRVYNKAEIFQDVKIADKVYTVMPHQYLAIKAPAGTAVYAESTGFGHRKGELLFAVNQSLKGGTVQID
jgi:hypothetical protein